MVLFLNSTTFSTLFFPLGLVRERLYLRILKWRYINFDRLIVLSFVQANLAMKVSDAIAEVDGTDYKVGPAPKLSCKH